MQTYEGELANKSERDWNGTMLYSFQLKGQNIWFRTGQKALTLDEGTLISFSANPTNKQVDISSMKTIDALSTVAAGDAPTASAPGTSPALGREDYWTARERRDRIRTARADACRVVCAALDNDVLALGAVKGKRLDLITGYIKEITEELMNYEAE